MTLSLFFITILSHYIFTFFNAKKVTMVRPALLILVLQLTNQV